METCAHMFNDVFSPGSGLCICPGLVSKALDYPSVGLIAGTLEHNQVFGYCVIFFTLYPPEWRYGVSSTSLSGSVWPRPQPALMWFLSGAPGGPCQQISWDEAPSCVTAAEPRILVWCARVIPQHMELLVTVKQAAVEGRWSDKEPGGKTTKETWALVRTCVFTLGEPGSSTFTLGSHPG